MDIALSLGGATLVGYFGWLGVQVSQINMKLSGLVARVMHLEDGVDDHEQRIRDLEGGER